MTQESVPAAPGPVAGRSQPPRRWTVDIGIALLLTAVQLAGFHASLRWGHPQAAAGWPSYLLLAAASMALTLRRSYPVGVLAFGLAATLWAGQLSPHALIWIGLIGAFVNAEIARKRAAAIASLVIGYLASFWPLWQIGDPGRVSAEVALAVAAWMLILLGIAELVRSRRQRAAAIAQSRQEQSRRQASEERMRIARDVHDVLAHNISVINVQANTALHLMDRQPERAREALTSIHEVSRQALAELRSVLGVLRSDGEYAPTRPSAGLAQLGDLVSAVGQAGLAVRVVAEGTGRLLPTDADLAAYRIVQEALTNTSRHSASRAAEVLIRYEPAGLLVQIDDAGPAQALAASAVPPGSGNGITGMTERAQALGGWLSAERRPGGGFRVAAWLPAPSAAASQAAASEAAGSEAAASQSAASQAAGSQEDGAGRIPASGGHR
jgi:signal transduction histidine kinase